MDVGCEFCNSGGESFKRSTLKFNIMKLKNVLLLALTLAASVSLATAQSNITLPIVSPTNAPGSNAPASAPTIAGTATTIEQWFTTFSSNTWANAHGYVETGPVYENQLQFADSLELGLNVWSPSTNAGLNIDNDLLTAVIAGTIVSDEIDLAWRLDVHDVQIQLGGGPFYDKFNDRVGPGVFAELQKHTGPALFAYVKIGLQYEGKNSPLQVGLGVGGQF
jgi:hypothetical protein